MASEKHFWDFLLAVNYPLKRSVYKKAILRGQLTLVAMVVGVAYIIIDYTNNIPFNHPYYIFLIIFSAFTLLINRAGKFNFANFIFLILLNGLIYVFASNDTYRSGVYIYFIVSSLTSLTLCGYEQLKTGLFFCSLSLLLFILAYILGIYPRIFHGDVPESYITIAFITNFSASLITTVILLFFLLEINYRTEAELEKNNELLTKTNKELDRFVYSASHDLRSPLSSMLGLVEIAKRSENLEEIKMCLDLMADRLKVQDSFIHDIIDYARNNRVSLSLEEFPLNEFVHEIINQLMYNDGAERIDFQVQIASKDLLVSDKARLTSVLSNLIGNSIKYHDKSKTKPYIRIHSVKSESHTEIVVEDNGQGIHPDYKEKIFDMFFRASRESKGSGLGLFIVKETLEKMGGKISLQSEYGKGSIFSITLNNELI